METTNHSMTRRATAHDYTRTGIYHITLHVAEGMGCPLGTVVGDAKAPDGHPDAPRVEFSPIGQMVEHELLHSITARYPMITMDSYVIMPDHVHFCCAPAKWPIPDFHKWMKFWKAEVALSFPTEHVRPLWQRQCWDTQLRQGESFEEKCRYMVNNPVRKGLVSKAED